MNKEPFLVEISARHVHVTQQDLETLFGKGHELTPVKDLSQPGQYAAAEKVTIVGSKGSLSARILGPVRKASQVEVSLTEARQLGEKALIRESGDLAGTSGIKLVGPAGEVVLEEGLIAAKRHIHMTPKDAEYYGVENGQNVKVRIESTERSLIFDDIVIRVSDSYALAMHIDTDEANAAGISGSTKGTILK
ncbi:MAG: phosphate propanoyltransferase [Erysipelotrichaceae bacterium]|nr:phosphate propanoyltransferase [Erysipelotrichaceae bacterium]